MENNKKILTGIEAQIKKLLILLYESDIPKDVQDSLIKILPMIEAEQIDRLVNVLEACFLDKSTRSVDEEYRKKIQEVLLDFHKQREKISRDFLKSLENFSNNLI